MPRTVLCADIGTSSLKAALVAEDGSVRASCRIPFILYGTEHASWEWLPSFGRATGILLENHADDAPCAVCISGNGPTLVSDDGTTLLWNAAQTFLTPAEQEIAEGSLFLPRILSFRKKHPEKWKETAHLLSGPEHLIFRLTGDAVTILPEPRYRSAYWTDAQLEALGLSRSEQRKLAPFAAPGTRAGTVTLQGTPLAGLPVFTGAPDFIAALAGTATLAPGMMCDRAGSSEGINLCTEKPLHADGIRTLPSLTEGLWNAGVLLPDTGSRFESYLKLVERTEGHSVTHADVVRSLLSEGDAIHDADVRRQGKALIDDIASQVSGAVALLCDTAQKAGCTLPSHMTVTGGQAANRDWNMRKARVTGLSVRIPAYTDAELTGDAVLAFTGMGAFGSFAEAAASLCAIRETLSPEGAAR